MGYFSSLYRSKFQDDEAKECDHCGEIILPGENYYVYQHDKIFCSFDCIGQYFYANQEGFEERHVNTAYENEMDYADRKYDEWKDREFDSPPERNGGI